MSDIKHTRLRYIESKSLEFIFELINRFGFKVEYKETIFVKGKYKLIYVLPETKLIKDPGNIKID
jgi:5-enolpyruvylshikimate-3-phosphate synthase